MTRRAILVALLLALLSACSPADTVLRLGVQYDAAWGVSELELAAGEDQSRIDAVREVLLLLPEAAAEGPLTVRVTGFGADGALAEGTVTVTPRLGVEVFTQVTLARLPCGASCAVGELRCAGDGVSACVQEEDGCTAWGLAEACPAATPFCTNGECAEGCADECGEGVIECTGTRSRRACGDGDSDPCLDWLPEDLCPTDQACTDGVCSDTCTSECTLGEVACRDDGQVRCAMAVAGCFRFGVVDVCDTPPTPEECYAATGTCAGGVCDYAFADGTSCDDGDPATDNDTCTSGVCAGEPDGRTWVEIAVGGEHACALRGSGTVVCWGRNVNGELGRGTMTPREPTPAAVTGLTDAVELSLGERSSCARRRAGTVVCWGDNGSGQLGNGTLTPASAPVAIPGLSGVVELASGARHVCARLSDGAVQCWGSNARGQLGDETTETRLAPVASMASGAVGLALGGQHSCAWLGSGEARCWGYNANGQLGDGSLEDRLAPVEALGVSGIVQLAAGYQHTCARLDDGTVVCWGANDARQSGALEETPQTAPVVVAGLSGVEDLGLGDSHSCAVVAGAVRCWGDGSFGQLGDDFTGESETPRVATGLSDARSVAGGVFHTCALREADAAVCWGFNTEGQLGDGTTTNRNLPGPVALPAE